MNMDLIHCLSKKQLTIEMSVFGAEFVVITHVMETLRGLRYKLRKMEVPISKPSYIYGGNILVTYNDHIPGSTLRGNSNLIFYHPMSDSVEMWESLTNHILTNDNPSDLMTKVLAFYKRQNHVCNILYDIYDGHH